MTNVFEVNKISPVDAAKYLLSLDPERKYFNVNFLKREGHSFYEGNARLNKILHLAQNIYIAMNDVPIIDASFFAYDNGAVITEVQENYQRLRAKKYNASDINIPDTAKTFLKKVFLIFADAPIDELIAIDHEDPEWINKNQKGRKLSKKEQQMDVLHFADDYKNRYKDIIKIMSNMENEQ